jgi:uncharacterized protein (DUF1330 family)
MSSKGYVILTEDIHDEAGMNAYGAASHPSLTEHHARILAVDTAVQVLEGTWHGTRTVVVEFPSVEAAHGWYASNSYQQALPLRQAAAACNVALVSGFSLASESTR